MSKVTWSVSATAWARIRVNSDTTAILSILPFLSLRLLFNFTFCFLKASKGNAYSLWDSQGCGVKRVGESLW